MSDRSHGSAWRRVVVASLAALLLAACAGRGPTTIEAEPFDPQGSSTAQRARIDALRDQLAVVVARAEASGPEAVLLLEHEDLDAGTDAGGRALLDAIRSQPGADPNLGIPGDVAWVRIANQVARTPDGDRTIPLQLVTESVWHAFRAMDLAMRDDIGRGLLIGSAYRSPAHQLQLIVALLPSFDYSLAATLAHVSLPGASDHNRVETLGLDFVSERGVDLAWSDRDAFAALAEHRWLASNAARFGFEPEVGPDGATPGSPWHWRFVGTAETANASEVEED
ncbi:MAG: D-alanyl-D-alanine carboxypeptidase family protein [Myxococcota bacterium]